MEVDPQHPPGSVPFGHFSLSPLPTVAKRDALQVNKPAWTLAGQPGLEERLPSPSPLSA